MSLLQDKMTKLHGPRDNPSSTASCKSLEMTLICTPFTTRKVAPQTACPLLTWTNYSQSETPKCSWPLSQSRTSLDCHKPQHHMNHTQVHCLQISTIAHAHRPPKLWKNLGLYWEMIGSTISRAWHCSTCTPSQDWGEGWWRPPSIGTTSSPSTPNSFCREDTTVPVTYIHSGQERTRTLVESSQARRLTPSSLGRCSPRWSTSPSNRKGTRPYVPKCSASEMPITESEIWPRTWPTSKSYTTICNGKSTTPYVPWPVSMPSATLSHASSTMPRQPRTSCGPCSTPASMTLQMDGSTAPISITNAASSVRGTGIQHVTVHISTNAYSAMEPDIAKNNAVFPTKDAELDKSAVSPMTTLEWPTPTVPRMSGPLDSSKDVNKGIMS
jgi:hypothetical protein